uniref:RNA-dependent RNA polymerase n=1 Tax=Capillidibolus rugosus virus 1 TaxID=2980983 RepID=A0A977R5H6_9VIRU|nr:RNA-dependent RNA polymerase [Capillidibolus rugosus virus 1]
MMIFVALGTNLKLSSASTELRLQPLRRMLRELWPPTRLLMTWLQTSRFTLASIVSGLDFQTANRVGGRALLGACLKQEVLIECRNPYELLAFDNDYSYPDDMNRDISRAVPKNGFLKSAMQKIGGGEQRLLAQMGDLERRGGGIDDGLKYLRLHDKRWQKCYFKFDAMQAAALLGVGCGELRPMPLNVVRLRIKHNTHANPGPTYKALGFKKKYESAPVAWDVCELLYKLAETQSVVGVAVPRYALAGRGKIDTRQSFLEKAEEGRPFGRAVWMADQHEQLAAAVFSQPLVERFAQGDTTIQIGFNKFGASPGKVYNELRKYNTFLSLDFSKFDTCVSPAHLTRAFDIMRIWYDVPRQNNCKFDRMLNWLEDEVVNTRVVSPTGRVINVVGGVPSGSGLTAILDSIVSGYILHEALYHLKRPYKLFVQGDDAVIGVKFSGGEAARYKKAAELTSKLSEYLLYNHGFVMNPDKCTLAVHLEVGYAQPILDKAVASSTAEIGKFRQNLRTKLGRELKFTDKFTVLNREPIGPAPGHTHRWTYLFNGRAKFLSHYFKRAANGEIEMIRPTFEVVTRMLLPEARVQDINDHIGRIACTVAEHLGNHHVVNKCMHYAYDAYLLRKAGVFKPDDLYRLGNSRDEHLSRRAWYRKIDHVVDLLYEEPEFQAFWRKVMRTATYLHGRVYGGSSADWSLVRALKRGGGMFKGTPSALTGPTPEFQDRWPTGAALKTIGRVHLGFTIWNLPETRQRASSLVFEILSKTGFNHECDEVFAFTRLVAKLRDSEGNLADKARLEWDF